MLSKTQCIGNYTKGKVLFVHNVKIVTATKKK